METSAEQSSERPTKVRLVVLAYLCGVTLILYLDRMCIGKAAPFIQDELALTNSQMGMIHAAFMLSYGLFEVYSGHLADRHGTRFVLTRIVTWWSLFTTLTGAATGFTMLLVTRFLFGAGEAGALPNVTRIIDRWFPSEARGKIRGFVNMPALIGGMIAPLLTAYLIELIGWRWVFAFYGLVGLIWAIGFNLYFRDSPAAHPGVNSAEQALIGPPSNDLDEHTLPFGKIARSVDVWLIGCVLMSGSSTVYLIFAWYPTYLEKLRGVSNVTSGWMNSFIMFGGAIGCLLGGWFVDIAARRISHPRWQKSVVGTGGFTLAAIAMLIAAMTDSVVGKTVWLAICCLGIHTHASAWWGVNSAISGRHVSAVFGVINSLGVLGGAVSQILFGYLPSEKWDQAFFVASGLLFFGAFCWSQVDARRRIFASSIEE